MIYQFSSNKYIIRYDIHLIICDLVINVDTEIAKLFVSIIILNIIFNIFNFLFRVLPSINELIIESLPLNREVNFIIEKFNFVRRILSRYLHRF